MNKIVFLAELIVLLFIFMICLYSNICTYTLYEYTVVDLREGSCCKRGMRLIILSLSARTQSPKLLLEAMFGNSLKKTIFYSVKHVSCL